MYFRSERSCVRCKLPGAADQQRKILTRNPYSAILDLIAEAAAFAEDLTGIDFVSTARSTEHDDLTKALPLAFEGFLTCGVNPRQRFGRGQRLSSCHPYFEGTVDVCSLRRP